MPISFGIKKAYTGPDEYTKLLLHFDEDPFVDSGAVPKTLNIGTVTRTDTQSVFGGYSAQFTANYMNAGNSDDWYFAGDNFTIDFHLRTPGAAPGTYPAIISRASDTTESKSWWLVLNSGNSTSFYFAYSTNGGIAGRKNIDFGYAPAVNTWQHIAIVRTGTELKLYVDGVKQGVTGNMGTDVIANCAQPLVLGSMHPYTGTYAFTGYLDEVRVSKGIARWTENFTPPTNPY